MSDIERDAFERIVRSAWSDSYSFEREAGDDYSDEVLEGMWWAWRARAKSESVSPQITMGVGDGSGRLFVHGDRDSIKACQAKLLELEKLRAKSDGGAVPTGCIPVPRSLVERWANVDAFNAPRGAAMELKVTAQMMLATPQQPAQGWIKCSERLPTEADADCYSKVHAVNKRTGVTSHTWWDLLGLEQFSDWMPTGLRRPTPPTGGE